MAAYRTGSCQIGPSFRLAWRRTQQAVAQAGGKGAQGSDSSVEWPGKGDTGLVLCQPGDDDACSLFRLDQERHWKRVSVRHGRPDKARADNRDTDI